MSNTNLPSLYSHTVEKFEISDLRSREFILSKQQEGKAVTSRFASLFLHMRTLRKLAHAMYT